MSTPGQRLIREEIIERSEADRLWDMIFAGNPG